MFRLSKDFFGNPQPPELYLCNTGRKIIGQLPAYDLSGTFKWNSYSEISFSVDRTYTDVLTGKTVVNPLFDKLEGLRNVYLKNIGFFTLQDADTTYSDKDSKQMSAFALEYATAGSKYLESFRINTGDVDSKEVIYESSKYGASATVDQMYKLARYDSWDADEHYYQRNYTDNDSYTYEEVQIANETAYRSYFGDDVPAGDVLYIHGYANVQFYDPHTPELSLLHLIFTKIPEWKIGHIDYSLRHKERKFDEERIAVYDFLMNNVSDTFRTVVEWDSINGVVNFYEEAEDGLNEDGTIQTRWNTDVFISRSNLASEVSISYSTDDIKTKLKVSGSDNLDIREVNIGQNYLLNLDYYHNDDWMEQDLKEAYSDYLEAVKEYSPQYTEAMQNWVEAYAEWDNLMNAVPAEGNVVLVGDEFKKLYCIYGLYNSVKEFKEETTYYIMNENGSMSVANPQPTAANFANKTYYVQGDYSAKEKALIDQLTLYHVNEDIEANKQDNILLRLKNNANDTATIRVYNASIATTEQGKKDNPVYKIQTIIVRATTGTSQAAEVRDLSDWINGDLRVGNTGSDGMSSLSGFKINYIGIMGAYFVLAKDERESEVLEEYGVNLLREKHDTYVSIFQTQTEAMFSQQKYQCIVQDNSPGDGYPDKTRWLDTNRSPVELKEYKATTNTWNTISTNVSEADRKDYENYQRYLDNYTKMVAVQNMLVRKEKEAEYWLNGYKIEDRVINYQPGDGDSAFYAAADSYFRTEDDPNNASIISNGTLYTDYGVPIFTFMHHSNQISYVRSTGSYNADTTYYKKIITVYDLDTYQPATSTTAANRKINITTYAPISIASKAVYDTYDGSSESKTLYVTQKNNLFAIYLVDNTPYVAYAESQGVYMAKMNALSELTEFERFFNADQWARLSPLIREDEYNNDNFLLTGYESEEERLKICQELMEDAAKELKTLAQPKLEFSMTMANILALPEFDPIVEQFALGNFIRIELRPGIIKRARLLEVNLNFDDLSDFSANFGNLVTTLDEVDKHAQLLSQAVQAGKTVATAASDWYEGTEKANRLETDIANGLQDATLKIRNASGQTIEIGKNGLVGRKLVDGTTDQYENEQVALINNKLVFTSDNWQTSKSCFGKFEVDGQEHWGVLSDAVVSGFISGSTIKGGTLEIGTGSTKFVVKKDGSVEILDKGQEKYAGKAAIDEINKAYQYTVELVYNGSTVFASTGANTIMTAIVRDLGVDITHKLPIGTENPTKFTWLRNGEIYGEPITMTNDNKPQEGVINTNVKTLTANQINITHADIEGNSFFSCQVDFDETKI
jgi:hypothetical protein